MVGDRRHDRDAVRDAQVLILFQDLIGQKSAVFRMAAAVNRVADVVHISCNPCKLDVMLRIAEFFQDMRSRFRYPDTMGL